MIVILAIVVPAAIAWSAVVVYLTVTGPRKP